MVWEGVMSGADMACLERQGLGLGLSRDFSRTYLLSQSVIALQLIYCVQPYPYDELCAGLDSTRSHR